jgi:hypothetical protein
VTVACNRSKEFITEEEEEEEEEDDDDEKKIDPTAGSVEK